MINHSKKIKQGLRLFLLVDLVLQTLTLSPLPAQAIETKAREALVVDYDTKTVLLSKKADDPMPTASMSKLMTAFMVFERLQDGRLSLGDKLPVSEKAWRKGGSKMFVRVGDEIAVRDLLRGIIVQSGNDACIVVAEAIGGSEENFAAMMTQRAKELGLKNSHFANATGWPHPNHYMSARDLATLADLIITRFPEYYGIFSEKSFVWSDIAQDNRNPLLYRNVGADGLKTGHTEEAGYSLVASAKQEDRRVILVVNGLQSTKARSEEATHLMAWAFREFDNFQLLKAGQVVEEAPVWLGTEKTVGLTAERDLILTLPRSARRSMAAVVRYDAPIETPIRQGQRLGEITISSDGLEPHVVPLVAKNSVDPRAGFGRIKAAISYLLFGKP